MNLPDIQRLQMAVVRAHIPHKDRVGIGVSFEERCAKLLHEYRRQHWETNHVRGLPWDELPSDIKRKDIQSFVEYLRKGNELALYQIVRHFVLALDRIAELEAQLEQPQ